MEKLFSPVARWLKGELSSCERFFTGAIYPPIAAALALLSHLTGLEYLFGGISIVLLCLAMLTCRSGRPILTFSLSIIFHVSLKNAPGVPTFSNYLFSGWRLVAFAVLAGAVAVCLIAFIVRNRCLSHFSIRMPQLIPLLILSVAFLANGIFGGSWSGADLVHGFCQAGVYLGLYLLYYLTLKGEDGDGLCRYLVYVCSTVGWLLIAQVLARLMAEGVIVNGSVDKNAMVFGWGVWNTAGVSLTVLLPICFIGVMRTRHPVYYFATAIAAYLAAVLTMSRGALLFGGIAFVICCILSCFVGDNKRVCRIVTLGGIAVCLGGLVLVWDKLAMLLQDFIDRGFSDNGRYELWRIGWENFLKAPLFGIGFFSFVSDSFTVAEFFPKLAHQTLIQFLSSTGLFGTLAYLYYRFVTILPVVRRQSLIKWMLFGSVLVLLAQSAIDTYMFRFHALLLYSATLAIIEHLDAEQAENK